MLKNKRQKSTMSHDFSRVPHANIERSVFKRSHGYKTAFNSSWLVPILVDEVLPGDTFNVRLSSVARLATPLLPFMDNLHMDFFFFFVPNRLLWTNWQRFMGERDPDPDSSTDFVVPKLVSPAGGFGEGTLSDFMGLPTDAGVGNQVTVNSLHHRGYNKIFNDWFRDENLQDSVTVDLDDGPDTIGDYLLLKRGKRHDYFTSCLPWPQKGAGIELPLGTQAPVTTLSVDNEDVTVKAPGLTSGDYPLHINIAHVTVHDDVNPVNSNPLYADLSSATAATINSLREAFQLQKLLERDARGGTRYTEILKSHFKVTSPDSRLQRSEYLGGGSTPIQVTPIAQTSESLIGTTQGHLTAVGYHAQSGVGFTKSFVEHGIIIGMANVRADLTYQQGLNRMWSRQTKYDFYWPALAHLGEQEVLNKEIYCKADGNDDLVFGYQERFAEYRYFPSLITGNLRSTAPTSLDAWHLAQEFTALPVLNEAFIQENPPVERVVSVTSEPQIVFDGYFDMICTRPMPVYSVPGMIDHF